MKNRKIVTIALALLAMTACQERFEEQVIPETQGQFPEFEAGIEDVGARTTLLPGGNIVWNADDRITVYPGNTTPVSYVVKEGTAGNISCTFIPEKAAELTGTPLSRNVAIYGPVATAASVAETVAEAPSSAAEAPASAVETVAEAPSSVAETVAETVAEAPATFTLTTVKPKEVRYEAEGMPEDFVMVAQSEDTKLQFRNCYGLLKLQFKGTAMLSKIMVKGSPEDFLSGKHQILFGEQLLPVCTPEGRYGMDWFSEAELLLDAKKLDPDTPEVFFLTLPPAEFKNGFEVVLTDISGKTKSFKAPAGNGIRRNDVRVMPPLEVLMDEGESVKITHNLYLFTVPTLTGPFTDGRIFWGDEIMEAYQESARHTYSTSGNHEVTITGRGAEAIDFGPLKGIIKIDLSQF